MTMLGPFSALIFDQDGTLLDAEARLVVNAPHIPVHLGSMSESIRSIIAANVVDFPDPVGPVTNTSPLGTPARV